MNERISLSDEVGGLHIDDDNSGHFRSVEHVGEVDKLPPNSSIHGYDPTRQDPYSQANPEIPREFDGAMFVINPGESTSPMKFTEPGYTAKRQVVSGKGHLICVSPEGEVFDYRLGGERVPLEIIELGEGWTDIIIADKDLEEPLQVVDVSKPAFKPEFERKLDEGSSEVPAEFWERIRELQDSTS